MQYPWIEEAEKYLGMKEIPGSKHNSTILTWLKELKAWWNDDETPWCGTMVAHCFKSCNIEVPELWMRAREWENWGVSLNDPTEGCIVTFSRKGGGHIGFVKGITADNKLLVLGGNQNNSISIAKFDLERVTSYRWPKEITLPKNEILKKINIAGEVSTDEA